MIAPAVHPHRGYDPLYIQTYQDLATPAISSVFQTIRESARKWTTSAHLSDEERHLRGNAAFVLPQLVMIGTQHHLKVMVRRIQRTSNWVVSTVAQ